MHHPFDVDHISIMSDYAPRSPAVKEANLKLRLEMDQAQGPSDNEKNLTESVLLFFFPPAIELFFGFSQRYFTSSFVKKKLLRGKNGFPHPRGLSHETLPTAQGMGSVAHRGGCCRV